MERSTKPGKYYGHFDLGRQRQGHKDFELVKILKIGLVLLVGLAAVAHTDEPIVDHQPVICSLPEKNPRICTYVADDGEVKKVRAYFRAEEQEAFYWTEMTFDGIQFCATLPVAKKSVRGVEYYIWAIDDNFESQRTRTYKISVAPNSPCEYPVFDEDPERIANLTVYATSPKQGDSIKEFEKDGIVRFVSAKRRKK
jgi:hypothetical protein